MPTSTGAETIRERLVRLRTQLSRVRDTIARHESNGQSFNLPGSAAVTEIAYERALARERELTPQIATLEARLAGSAARPGIATVATKFD